MEHGHVSFCISQATSDSSRCWCQLKANGCERMRHAERVRHGQSECNEHEGNSQLRHFYLFHLLVSFKNILQNQYRGHILLTKLNLQVKAITSLSAYDSIGSRLSYFVS